MTNGYHLGRYFCGNPHHALLHHVLDNVLESVDFGLPRAGMAVEFGTGSGDSARCIARYMEVVTFGSSDGLPEDWRPGFEKGAFADTPQELPRNVTFHEGLFDDTLPGLEWPDDIALVHFDADLYSSTATALKHVGPHLHQGCVLIFDEWWGYPGCEEHEQLAFKEFVDVTAFNWKVIGHGVQQWAVRLV